MSFFEDEAELFGLNEAAEAPPTTVHVPSESEDDYDDDPDEEGRAAPPGPPAPPAEGDDQEGSDPNAAKIVKPKRVIKNPQAKLDVPRLCGSRGIGIVQKWLSEAPYKGKGYETEDLGILLKKLQHWAHRLYPKLPFSDCLLQIEKLGNKKALQVNVKRLRLDLYETPEDVGPDGLLKEKNDDVARLGDGDNASSHDDVPDVPDVFDELLRQSGAAGSLQQRATTVTATNMTSSAPLTPVAAPPKATVVLSAELLARIERNKQLALARRQARLSGCASTPKSDATSVAGTPLSGTLVAAATSTPKSTVDNNIPQQSSIATVENVQDSVVSSRSENVSKRKRDDAADSEEEVIQPTQAELRNLREGLLNSVGVSQQSNPTTDISSQQTVSNAFSDEFDEMNEDDVLDALNKAESENMDSNYAGNTRLSIHTDSTISGQLSEKPVQSMNTENKENDSQTNEEFVSVNALSESTESTSESQKLDEVNSGAANGIQCNSIDKEYIENSETLSFKRSTTDDLESVASCTTAVSHGSDSVRPDSPAVDVDTSNSEAEDVQPPLVPMVPNVDDSQIQNDEDEVSR